MYGFTLSNYLFIDWVCRSSLERRACFCSQCLRHYGGQRRVSMLLLLLSLRYMPVIFFALA
jgi:hypothetical protein